MSDVDAFGNVSDGEGRGEVFGEERIPAMSARATRNGGTLPVAERRHVDKVCDGFESAWRDGKRPDLASFLEGTEGPARTWLFRELLILDLEYRLRAGEQPDASDYRSRFADLTGVVDDAFTLGEPARPT